MSDRGEGLRVWLEWAERYANRLDPLSEPHKVAKVLDPDMRQLGLSGDDEP